jgi:restriction system protein
MIRRSVLARTPQIHVTEDWYTPAGRPRTMPMYETVIANGFLGVSRTIKGKDHSDVISKAREQLKRWGEQEVKQRTREAGEYRDGAAKDQIAAIENILRASLQVDDRLDWNAMLDTTVFEAFSFEPAPSALLPVKKPWYAYLLPFLARRWEAQCAAVAEAKRVEVSAWEVRRARAWHEHEQQRARRADAQREHNAKMAEARRRYEAGDIGEVIEYLSAVFERSQYPEGFFVEHGVAFEQSSRAAVVDVELPPQAEVPNVSGFKFVASRNELVPTTLKPKDHAALYDSAVKQCVIRTMHEVFESDYAGNAQACVVNGFVAAVDGATGKEKRTCIISVSAGRQAFEALDLSRVDPSSCIKGLKGLIAGPLSEVAPVKPILQLCREDSRFVDARDVLDEVGEQNLAEMDWETFEQLVRELCSKLFTTEGAEVKVTQASRDKGVDAIAFDPDPIRGGKFVVQAKRYTTVVPVSAVRDLYGTLINEGATRGILVTTAHYGRDAREFAKDKPLTLIDGPNLVHLLEEHGYRVRLDVQAARRNAKR